MQTSRKHFSQHYSLLPHQNQNIHRLQQARSQAVGNNSDLAPFFNKPPNQTSAIVARPLVISTPVQPFSRTHLLAASAAPSRHPQPSSLRLRHDTLVPRTPPEENQNGNRKKLVNAPSADFRLRRSATSDWPDPLSRLGGLNVNKRKVWMIKRRCSTVAHTINIIHVRYIETWKKSCCERLSSENVLW